MPNVIPVLPDGVNTVRMTNRGIAAAVWMAGWPDDVQAVAVAVALAESSGTVTAINKSSGAAGLFQILPDAHPDMISGPTDTRWTSPLYNASGALKIWEDAGRKWTPWEAHTNGSYAPFLGPAQLAVAGWQGAIRLKTDDQKLVAYKDAVGDAWAFDQVLFLRGAFEGLKVPLEVAGKGIYDTMAEAGQATSDAVNDLPGVKQAGAIAAVGELFIGAAKWLSDQGNWVRIAQVTIGGALAIGALVVVVRPMAMNATNAVSKLKPI